MILGCTGFLSMLIFAALVVAFPARRSHKLAGLLLGLAVIFPIDLGRLVIYVWLAAWNPALNRTLHDYVYNTGHVLLVLGLWVGWMETAVKPALRMRADNLAMP